MLIVRRNETNNLVVTMSMNRTLNNPYYLFSFQHIASNESVRFYPTILSSNTRYDLISFIEGTNQNLSLVPPIVSFPYLGQYYYSIYEMASSGTTNPSNAYSKLESGRAWLINDNDNDDDCYYDEYISDDEIDEKDIYVDDCDNPITPSATPTPTITPTKTITPTPSITPTCPIFTTQYLRTRLLGCTNFDLTLFNNSNLTGNANAICDYVVSGTAIGDLGTVFSGTETIATGQHVHTFNLSSVLLPEECVSSFTVHSVTPQCPCVNVIIGSITPTPTPTITSTPTITPTNSETPTPTITPTNTITPTITPTNSETPTPTITPTNSETPTPTITPTNTITPSITPTITSTPTITPTNSETPTPTITPTNTITPSITPTITPTSSITPTPTITPTITPSTSPAPPLDPDAQAYLNAVTLSGGTYTLAQQTAINNLFVNLKANSLYSKIVAMYPFVGGSAEPHRINAVNLTAHTITFNGGWTHTTSGVTANAINAYANTNVAMKTHLLFPDVHLSYRQTQTSPQNSGWDGYWNGSPLFGLNLTTGGQAGLGLYYLAGSQGVISDYTDIMTVTRTAINNGVFYTDTTALKTDTTNRADFPTGGNYYFGSLNDQNGTPNYYNNNKYNYYTLGTKILPADITNWVNTWNTFLTEMGRV